jgi:Mg2+ and Co2+ transporter CorA
MWPTEKMWNYVDEKMSEYSTILGKGKNSSTASSNIHVETFTNNVTSNVSTPIIMNFNKMIMIITMIGMILIMTYTIITI